MEETKTYDQAYKELEAIARDIENESISVDELAVKVRRTRCKSKTRGRTDSLCEVKLKSAEIEVNKIINQIDKNKA